MAWERDEAWGEVLDWLDCWWSDVSLLVADALDESVMPDQWDARLRLTTLNLAAAYDRATPHLDPSPMTELFSRLASFYRPDDHFAVSSTADELKRAALAAQWLRERTLRIAIISDPPSPKGVLLVSVDQIAAVTHLEASTIRRKLKNLPRVRESAGRAPALFNWHAIRGPLEATLGDQLPAEIQPYAAEK